MKAKTILIISGIALTGGLIWVYLRNKKAKETALLSTQVPVGSDNIAQSNTNIGNSLGMANSTIGLDTTIPKEGDTVRAFGNDTVYLIQDGKKMPITLAKWITLSYKAPIEMDGTKLDSLFPTGELLDYVAPAAQNLPLDSNGYPAGYNLQDGMNVISDSGAPEQFVLESGKKRPMTAKYWEVVLRWQPYTKIPETVMVSIPTGSQADA